MPFFKTELGALPTAIARLRSPLFNCHITPSIGITAMKLGSQFAFKPLSELLARLLLGLLLPGLLLLSGCTTWFNSFTDSTDVPLEFRISEVEAASRPGLFTVAGETSLPDKTRITVAAFRSLSQTGASGTASAERAAAQTTPNYAILDRRIAEVQQGTWKIDLNLWKIAPNGDFREIWQIDQSALEVRFQPQPEVTFLATLEPANQPADLQPQLSQLSESARATLAQYTPEGEPYLQASQTIAVALPTGKTTPPAAPAQPTASRPVKVTPASEQTGNSWKQTSAPIAPDAFLR
ncbi:hypothetical protein IFO70_08055 [Phormidium tenue FACHB-886]|nr:hypothetical protein [Phormidium tenue FACHB-886]